jgi:hypothetical protein
MASQTDSDGLSLATVIDSDGLSRSEIDRVPLSHWYESRGIARATAFRLVKVAGITPHKIKVPGGRAPVSALDPAMVTALDALSDRLRAGESMAQLEASSTRAITVTEPSETVSDDHQDQPVATDAAALLQRLQAIELAIATGAPLSTADVSMLLGARPGGPVVTRARVTATRHGRNLWSLTQTV